MLTPEQLKDAGIFPDADAQDCMWVESGLEWLKAYTTLPLGTIDGDTLSALPAGAKLFLQQYRDTVQGGNVTSESIEGLSQSFSSDGICNSLIALAQGLLPKWFTAVRFVPKQQQWTYRQPERWDTYYD